MANVSITCIDKISASNGHILIKVLPPTFCVKFGEINDRSRRTQPASPRNFIGLELMRWWLVIGQSSISISAQGVLFLALEQFHYWPGEWGQIDDRILGLIAHITLGLHL